LTPDGKRVVPQSDPALPLVGDNMLSVTQAPDGSLVDTRYLVNSIFVHKPIENPHEKVVVYGVLPRRGSQAGGYNLSIYGVNFHKGNPSVLVGSQTCTVQSVSATMIVCNIPGGQGTVDIVVKVLSETSTFRRVFCYITGIPI
jgi:IPT/TIG domain